MFVCGGGGWVYVVKWSQNGGTDIIEEKTDRVELNCTRNRQRTRTEFTIIKGSNLNIDMYQTSFVFPSILVVWPNRRTFQRESYLVLRNMPFHMAPFSNNFCW
jgi:hypothetical protein